MEVYGNIAKRYIFKMTFIIHKSEKKYFNMKYLFDILGSIHRHNLNFENICSQKILQSSY
jgi:hypothetical protein